MNPTRPEHVKTLILSGYNSAFFLVETSPKPLHSVVSIKRSQGATVIKSAVSDKHSLRNFLF